MGEEKRPKAMALGEAVQRGIVANETLAYFIGRTFLFMCAAGINPRRLRFRQHLKQEMAHYAADCWDAEVRAASRLWVRGLTRWVSEVGCGGIHRVADAHGGQRLTVHGAGGHQLWVDRVRGPRRPQCI